MSGGGFDHHADIVTATIAPDGLHVSLTIETTDGDVYHIGEKGGMTLDYLEGLFDEYGDEMYDYLLDTVDGVSYGEST